MSTGAERVRPPHIMPKRDDSHPIRATAWEGKKKVSVIKTGAPQVTDQQDAVLRVTSTCICGSDLHLYQGAIPGMEKGDIMGHEFMGIVEQVGNEVHNFRPGDRVVACFDIACGQCFFCKNGDYSCCEVTNPSKEMEKLYGHHIAGVYGYSHLTGGYPGGQADMVRVPFADVNLLHLPKDLPDEKVILLSDILPTAWWANEMGEVGKGDIVAIWGAGPVGQLAAHCAFYRGASRVIMIDNQEYRLEHAKKRMPNGKVETINFNEVDVPTRMRELVPRGPDVGIEAVGLHYTKTLTHKAEMTLGAETDPSEMMNEIIYCVRKAGRISDVGVYAGYTNHFNIGAFMEKAMTMRGGQTPVQRFWHDLLKKIQGGELDPTFVITHKLPLDQAPKGYHIFDEKLDNCIKVVLQPGLKVAEE